MAKKLYIVRGLPGSGKSTFAEALVGSDFLVCEADKYFMQDGEYKFDGSKLNDAHNWCRHKVMDAMKEGEPIVVVSNTFTREWEMDPYFLIGKELGYKIFVAIVENHHGGKNTHGVPENTIEVMRDRFEFKL
jgi:predicted kinase